MPKLETIPLKKLNNNFGYNRIVLVTGGLGFIGSAFLRNNIGIHPWGESHFFINIDDMRAGSNPEAVAEISPRGDYAFHKVALEDAAAVNHIFETYNITDVVHFAAESDVDRSIGAARNTVESNVIGTLNLLEAVVKYAPRAKFLYVSTDEVYGDAAREEEPFTEESPINPSSPYSASKAAAEALVMAYGTTHGIDYVITRGANTFGPWQDTTKLIPKAVKYLKEGKKIPIYGNGLQTREWISVDRHVEGIYKAWKAGHGEIYNLTSGVSLSTLDIANLIIEAVKAPADSLEFVEDRKGHDRKYWSSHDKAWRHFGLDLGSHVAYSLEHDIQDTALWYYNR